MKPLLWDKDVRFAHRRQRLTVNLTAEGAEALNGLLKSLRWERDHAIHFAVVNELSIRNEIMRQVQQ